MVLVDFSAIARTVGHLSKSAEVMKLVNNLMKAPEVAVTMQEFSKEMTKVFPFLGMVSRGVVLVVVEVSLTATNERNDRSLADRDVKFLGWIAFYQILISGAISKFACF